MKKIINGKRYDTDTAKLVAEYEDDRGDIRWTHEELYQKRTGEYFIYGEGGPASRYSARVGLSGSTGSYAFVPCTYEEARKWAEDHLDADEYESAFEVVEDDDYMLSVRISAQARASLDRHCARTGRQKGQVVSELLMQLQ